MSIVYRRVGTVCAPRQRVFVWIEDVDEQES